MKRIWTVLAALCLFLIATDGAQAISSPSGIDSRLRFEYEVGLTRHGKPEIQGYIYNDYARPANNVRMIVETLDESGQVIGRAYGYVFGIVPVFNRTPFNVPLQTAGASYRLTVTSFEWRDLGASLSDEKGPSASFAPSTAVPRNARDNRADELSSAEPRHGPALPLREYASRCLPSVAASHLDPSHRSSWVSPTGS